MKIYTKEKTNRKGFFSNKLTFVKVDKDKVYTNKLYSNRYGVFEGTGWKVSSKTSDDKELIAKGYGRDYREEMGAL